MRAEADSLSTQFFPFSCFHFFALRLSSCDDESGRENGAGCRGVGRRKGTLPLEQGTCVCVCVWGGGGIGGVGVVVRGLCVCVWMRGGTLTQPRLQALAFGSLFLPDQRAENLVNGCQHQSQLNRKRIEFRNGSGLHENKYRIGCRIEITLCKQLPNKKNVFQFDL